MDLLLGVEHRELALHLHQHPAHALLDVQRLEQGLALRRRRLDIGGDEVGELPWVLETGDDPLHRLLGQARALAELGRALAQLAHQRHERRVGRPPDRDLLGVDQHRLQVAVVLEQPQRRGASLAVQHHLEAGETALDLRHGGDGADGEKAFGADLVDVLALREDEDPLARLGERRLDRLESRGAAGADRHGEAGKEHRVAQGQHGEGVSLGHRGPFVVHDPGSWSPPRTTTPPEAKFQR